MTSPRPKRINPPPSTGPATAIACCGDLERDYGESLRDLPPDPLHTIPKRQSKAYNMQAIPGGLLFNDASPDDVHQMSLDMAPKPTAQRESSSRRDREEEEMADVG